MNRTSFAGRQLGVYTAFIALSLSTVFTSCKKEENPVDPAPPASQPIAYSLPLTDGSYWIFQHEQTDSLGNVVQTGALDSTFVEGDTTIGTNVFKKVRTIVGPGGSWFPPAPLRLLRDSAGYLVDETGYFIEHDNFTDTLEHQDIGPGIVNAWYFMQHEDSSVTVPAGTFLTIDYRGHMYATDPNYPHPNLRYTHRIYADQVGLIAEVLYFYNSPGYIQRRLVRYHIQ